MVDVSGPGTMIVAVMLAILLTIATAVITATGLTVVAVSTTALVARVLRAGGQGCSSIPTQSAKVSIARGE